MTHFFRPQLVSKRHFQQEAFSGWHMESNEHKVPIIIIMLMLTIDVGCTDLVRL